MATNRAVIIGLGGTGKWVLTYIKKNLLDTYAGQIPPTIKLLSFDTTQERGTNDGGGEEEARIGDVRLDQTEFFYLGGNIRQICLDIRDNNAYPHIGTWLQASTYLSANDPGAFDITNGAGQKRPFGRMAIFYDLQARVQSVLANRIRQAITDVNAANGPRGEISIYVVASLAGGTGSGMFIDVAHLARWFASKQLRDNFAIRGFLALQNTFRAVLPLSYVDANVAAGLRELDRFMLVFDQKYPIVYNPQVPEFDTIYGGETGKIFDSCYLLDATRDGDSLDTEPPKYGVYPSIADCITMMTDISTGQAFKQHYENVNQHIAEAQSLTGQPNYSSLGTYSLILPVEDMTTSLSYRFALELLGQYLLRTEQRSDAQGNQQLGLIDDVTQKAALDFLRAPKHAGIENTLFIRTVANLVERNINQREYQREIAEMSADQLMAWLLPPENDPTVVEIANAVREILQIQLAIEVQPSNIEGDEYDEGSERIKSAVADFKNEYLGREVGDRRIGGRYRNALEQCVELQRARYRKMLREHLSDLLNGPAPENKDFQQQRRGRLGYTRNLLAHLTRAFDRFDTLLSLAQRYRNESDELRVRHEDAVQYRSRMEQDKSKGSFLGTFIKGVHPAVKAQRAYLEAEQNVIDYEVNELLFEHMRNASVALRKVTEEYKAAVDAWLATLFEGFSGTHGASAYKRLLERQTEHAANREAKKRIVVREFITDDHYEDELYHQYTEGRFEEALAKLVWSIEEKGGSLRLDLPGLVAVTGENSQARTLIERDADYFLTLARSYFEPVKRLTIAERLRARASGRDLAEQLSRNCSPLIRFVRERQGNQELKRFVCISEGNENTFIDEVTTTFRSFGTQAADNQIFSAANPYTCTILATADVISSHGILPYIAAEEAYNNYQGDARLLHIFPAEVCAVSFEQRLPKIHEQRRKFSPRLTAMLENRKRVEQFVLCYLYKLIDLEAAESLNRYVLRLTPTGWGNIDRFELTRAEPQPSLIIAMETFIFKQADMNNTAIRIDPAQVEDDLRAREAVAMGGQFSKDARTGERKIEGGDESRLINLLYRTINLEIMQLRHSRNVVERDLASLMILLISDKIEGLRTRLLAQGKQFDAKAEPYRWNKQPAGAAPIAVQPVSSNGDHADATTI